MDHERRRMIWTTETIGHLICKSMEEHTCISMQPYTPYCCTWSSYSWIYFGKKIGPNRNGRILRKFGPIIFKIWSIKFVLDLTKIDEFRWNSDCLGRIPWSSTAEGNLPAIIVKCTRWKPKKHRYGYIYILIHTWFLTNPPKLKTQTPHPNTLSHSTDHIASCICPSYASIYCHACMPLQFRTNNRQQRSLGSANSATPGSPPIIPDHAPVSTAYVKLPPRSRIVHPK